MFSEEQNGPNLTPSNNYANAINFLLLKASTLKELYKHILKGKIAIINAWLMKTQMFDHHYIISAA